jgi:xylulokinase
VILTLDLGTSRTKAALWGPDGLVGVADVALVTTSPAPGAMEQDPSKWWASVVAACTALGTERPDGLGAVEVVTCTGARQTFGLFDAAGRPTGPGILWSDSRAAVEADGDVDPGGSVVAKLAWVAAHRADQLERSAWILAPRDAVVWRLCGTVATDSTLASLTGCYRPDGTVVDAVRGHLSDRLPPVVDSDRVIGVTGGDAAGALGIRPGLPVVIGAGDRPCEVLGTGATTAEPMVSWGTTANVSLPVDAVPVPPLGGVVVTRGATGGWLLEGGLSGAGSFLAWLGRLCGRSPDELATLAATSPPGARGVTAVPWLGGARAPWWRPGAGAAFVGLADAHGPADLARAVVESVARDVARCLAVMGERIPAGPGVSGLGLAGGGASTPVWVEVLCGTTGLPARYRRSGQTASAGAALLAARATGDPWDLERLDPVAGGCDPDPAVVRTYADLTPRAQQVAESLVDLPPATARV